MQDYSKRKKDWNLKTRLDDKRGYKDWTTEAKLKVRQASMRHPQLNDKAWLVYQYITLKKNTVQIAEEVGCVTSTVFHALKVFNIPRRSRKEMVARGDKHYQWAGGTSLNQRDTNATIYKQWRMRVYVRDGFLCQMCGVKGCRAHPLQAHHIMPYKTFPDLRLAVSNGISLCKPCHLKVTHKELQYADYFKSIIKGGELLGSLEQTISSQDEMGTSCKVQRLEDEARKASNSSTSAVHPKRMKI